MPVREMGPDDIVQVSSWKTALWDGGGDDDPDEVVFVWASEEGVLGGFVSLSVRPWAEGCLSEPVPYIEGWYVAEPFRRRGVGRALLEAAEDWARGAGFDEIGSDVRLDNEISLSAHRRMGFIETERLQYFRKPL